MNKLEQAAQALLAHWDTPAWKYLKPTGDLMADLREALKVTEASISDHKLAEQAEQEPMTNLDMLENWLKPIQVKVVAEISGVRSEIHPALPMGTLLYAAPIRTKDLSDDEIGQIWACNEGAEYFFARAVIAADREKNK